MIFMHLLLIIVLFLNELTKKNTKLDMNIEHSSVSAKIITPILLFVFNKTSENPLSEFLFIELLIFATNMVISVELQRIVLLKQCQYFGWEVLEGSGKTKGGWSRQKALKNIIMSCCLLIVTQNLLLMLEKIKYQISVMIWHSFAVAALSYLLYEGYSPFRK